jgi:hypothetical protein
MLLMCGPLYYAAAADEVEEALQWTEEQLRYAYFEDAEGDDLSNGR